MSEDGYRQWLDDITSTLTENWPPSAFPPAWGTARKGLNLFMRDALYNQYLNSKYQIDAVEKWMEIILDSKVAEGLRKLCPELPVWRGLKGLKPGESSAYQQCAQCLADKKQIARVHLDIELWLENR